MTILEKVGLVVLLVLSLTFSYGVYDYIAHVRPSAMSLQENILKLPNDTQLKRIEVYDSLVKAAVEEAKKNVPSPTAK